MKEGGGANPSHSLISASFILAPRTGAQHRRGKPLLAPGGGHVRGGGIREGQGGAVLERLQVPECTDLLGASGKPPGASRDLRGGGGNGRFGGGGGAFDVGKVSGIPTPPFSIRKKVGMQIKARG